MRLPGVFLAIILLVGCDTKAPPQPGPRMLDFSGPTMGTQYHIKVLDVPEGDAAVQLKRTVEQRLDQLNGMMSTYDSSSDVSLFNNSESVQWENVPDELAQVVGEAVHTGLMTEGAFDITCGPLVDLWGFGPDPRNPDRIPTDQQIAEAKARIGLKKIEYQLDPHAIRKTIPELRIDLSGVAKGFAVDQIALLFRSLGIASFLVDIGGEVRAQGINPDGKPWRIGIEPPLPGVRQVQRVVELTDMAMATSGDYRNYFEHDGVRYSHIIDPRTGRPIHHRLVSVSVVDPTCARADALATGLMVLGPEEGYRLAKEQELAVLMIVKTDTGFCEKMTPEFERICPQPKK